MQDRVPESESTPNPNPAGGKSKSELLLQQNELIERTRNAARFHRDLAQQCEKAGLRVLARWHEAAASEGLAQLELQIRALRKEGLAKE